MADATGQTANPLMESLLQHGRQFSFIQVLRILQTARGGSPAAIQVRPALSLAFPASDVAGVEQMDGGHRVEVNFLGLYGVSTPLPTFYTEELMEEKGWDITVTRDFLDLVHGRLYQLHFECWRKYRLWNDIWEGEAGAMERFYCLIGLGGNILREPLGELPASLIRYAPLFTVFPRSAAGLELLLSDYLGGAKVRVRQCVRRQVAIPAAVRFRLGQSGCTLGEDAVLGEEIVDGMGKFRLQIGPLDQAAFASMLPGATRHAEILAVVDLYLADPLDLELELVLSREEVKSARLGNPDAARLGLNSWCFAGSFERDAPVTFQFPAPA